jgi:hypothetical protein
MKQMLLFPSVIMYIPVKQAGVDYRKEQTPSLHIEHLENFITEVVADFDGDFACRGSRERPAGGAGKVIKGKR